MSRTSIAYADYTFSPWQGCYKVSEGCLHCFAEAVDTRFYGGGHWGQGAPRSEQSEAYWQEPRHWNRRAEVKGVRRRVLCGTMCDVLEPNALRMVAQARERLWQLVRETRSLDWMLLTKREQQLIMVPTDLLAREHLWVGVTVETQRRAEQRLPRLIGTGAQVRWISAEPLLEPLDLRRWLPWIDWLVVGAESGRGRRSMPLDWVRDLRDQCAECDTAFYFKQSYEPPSRVRIDRPALDGHQHQEFPHV